MKSETRTKVEINPFVYLLEQKGINCKLVPNMGTVSGLSYSFIEIEDRITVFPQEFLDKYDTISTNKNARALLIYIMGHLTYGSDKIQLIVDKLSEALGIPRSTMYDTLDKLEALDFIKHTGKRNMYWINPTIMFKGSRLTLYPEAIVCKDKDTIMVDRLKSKLVEARHPQLKAQRLSAFSDQNATSFNTTKRQPTLP